MRKNALSSRRSSGGRVYAVVITGLLGGETPIDRADQPRCSSVLGEVGERARWFTEAYKYGLECGGEQAPLFDGSVRARQTVDHGDLITEAVTAQRSGIDTLPSRSMTP